MVDDDDGDESPSPEPRTDSRSALPREIRAWRRLRVVKRDETFSLIFFLPEREYMELELRSVEVQGAHEIGGRPLSRGHPGHRFALILLPKNHKYSKKIFVRFYHVWTPFDIGFLRNKKHATDRNWHWALDQYVSPKK